MYSLTILFVRWGWKNPNPEPYISPGRPNLVAANENIHFTLPNCSGNRSYIYIYTYIYIYIYYTFRESDQCLGQGVVLNGATLLGCRVEASVTS